MDPCTSKEPTKTYKYCIVPECDNTSSTAPDKLFFFVPRGEDIRRKWCDLLKRTMISPITSIYCCEDHFDVEKDADNYMRYKIMNLKYQRKTTALRLKKGIVPHKFECRLNRSFNRKRKLEVKNETLSESTANQHSMISVSYLKPCSSFEPNRTIIDSKKIGQVEDQKYHCILTALENEPEKLLGLPKESYCFITLLAEDIPSPTIDVLITLKKIKLNETFTELALQFGYSEDEIIEIFSTTIPSLATKMQNLIVWLKPKATIAHLPIIFRNGYSDVYSIVDCLEIEIEMPSDVVHQSLTSSQDKKCNTLKYLISYTPSGTVNFVSNGYSSKAALAMIIEDSGFLEFCPPRTAVMIDENFEDISHLLAKKNCVLIRTSVEPALGSNGVKQSKKLERLKTHLEYVVNRLREFRILVPHSCMDHSLLPIIDDIVIVACGIINMQKFDK